MSDFMDDPNLSTQQRQMLIELHGLSDQIRKGHCLNVHFRAFQLAHAAWQEHIRQNAVSGSKYSPGKPVSGSLIDDE